MDRAPRVENGRWGGILPTPPSGDAGGNCGGRRLALVARRSGAVGAIYGQRGKEKRGTDAIPIEASAETTKIAESLKKFSKAIESSSANILLKDI